MIYALWRRLRRRGRKIVTYSLTAASVAVVLADLGALLGWLPWIQSQIHAIMLVTICFTVIDRQAQIRATRAVEAYRLGHMAGRMDQQEECERAHGHQALRAVSGAHPIVPQRSPRHLRTEASGGSNVVELNRR